MEMKIFTLKPDQVEGYLEVRMCNFTEPNREALREHAKVEHNTDLVWFEDELPPDELIQDLMEGAALEEEGDDA